MDKRTLKQLSADERALKAERQKLLEDEWARILTDITGVEPVREFKFFVDQEASAIKKRTVYKEDWRLDFAWPEQMFAVEVNGFGGHNTRKGRIKDMAKFNVARSLGWTLIEVVPTTQKFVEPKVNKHGKVLKPEYPPYCFLTRPEGIAIIRSEWERAISNKPF